VFSCTSWDPPLSSLCEVAHRGEQRLPSRFRACPEPVEGRGGASAPGVVTRDRSAARSSPSQASAKARYVVNRILAESPAGRARFYNSRRKFPAGRKGGCDLGGEGDKTSPQPRAPDTTVIRPLHVQVERCPDPGFPEPRLRSHRPSCQTTGRCRLNSTRRTRLKRSCRVTRGIDDSRSLFILRCAGGLVFAPALDVVNSVRMRQGLGDRIAYPDAVVIEGCESWRSELMRTTTPRLLTCSKNLRSTGEMRL